MEDAEKRRADIETAKEIVRAIGAECQETAQRQIDFVVTRCLQAVFGDGAYQFKLVFEQKRGQTEARAVLLDRDSNEFDPVHSVGGGILDVITFGLRLACLKLSRPKLSQVLILDEPFRFLSEQYRDNVKHLLHDLSNSLHMQIIMVSHVTAFIDTELFNVIEIK